MSAPQAPAVPKVPELLRAGDVAGRLGVTEKTIRRWVATSQFPPPVRLGPRLLRWDPADIALWLRALPKRWPPAAAPAPKK